VISTRPSVLCLSAVLALVAAHAQTIEHETERERWQQIAEIFKAMAIGPGSVVADVGAGDGFLSVRLAPIVGEKGRVYAVDIAEDRLARLRKRVSDAHLENLDIVLGSADNPRLPASQLDAVVILNAYHEMPRNDDMLRHIRDSLKPGGRLVIAEPSPKPGEESRAQQIAKHHISSTFVAEEMARAGFTIVEKRDAYAQLPGGSGVYSLVVGRRSD
jgi:ubiquinone/menaquinone biosynthesis C-methylase UbiE